MSACLDKSSVPQFARSYAKAVAGQTQSFAFNTTTRVATLIYTIKPTCTQPTILFASTTWMYPAGYHVALQPATAATWQPEGPDHVIVTHTAPVQPITLTVTITPV